MLLRVTWESTTPLCMNYTHSEYKVTIFFINYIIKYLKNFIFNIVQPEQIK